MTIHYTVTIFDDYRPLEVLEHAFGDFENTLVLQLAAFSKTPSDKNLDLLGQALIKFRLCLNGLQEKKEDEWQQMVARTAEVLTVLDNPYASFAKLICKWESEIIQKPEEHFIILTSLSEVILKRNSEESLHRVRCRLLHELVKIYDNSEVTLKLFSTTLSSDSTHPIHTSKRVWQSQLREFEEDILVTICTNPNFRPSTRGELIRLCLGSEGDAKTAKLASTIVVRAFTGSKSIDAFLADLYKTFTHQTTHAFYNPSATLLWLLLGSTLEEDRERPISCHRLLFYALPYCIDDLTGLTTSSLKKSVDGTDEELSRALCESMNELSLAPTRAPTETEWHEVHKLLCRVLAPRCEDALELLKKSLIYWYSKQSPSTRRTARVLSLFQEIARKVDETEEQVLHKFITALIEFDDNFIRRHNPPTSARDAFFLDLLVALFGKELTNLQNNELISFNKVVYSIRTSRYIRAQLIPHCLRHDATEEEISLLLLLAPFLDTWQLMRLYNKTAKTALFELFIQAVASSQFPFQKREELFHNLYFTDIIAAARLYSRLPLSKLLLLLQQMEMSDDSHSDELRHLFDAHWIKDTEIGNLLQLFTSLGERYGVEISLSNLEAKLAACQSDMKQEGQKQENRAQEPK